MGRRAQGLLLGFAQLKKSGGAGDDRRNALRDAFELTLVQRFVVGKAHAHEGHDGAANAVEHLSLRRAERAVGLTTKRQLEVIANQRQAVGGGRCHG